MSDGPTTPIYMDYNATTPVDPRVFEAMAPFFCRDFGNAASRTHVFGELARRAVENARQQVAALIGANVDEIVFTSGATESNNCAIKGVAEAYRARGRHIITQGAEHKAVLDPCKRLAGQGFEVTVLRPDKQGIITPQQVQAAIRPDTILVSIMWANNETGVIQDIRGIGEVCREWGCIFHTDATQAVGKVTVDTHLDHIDLLSLSAHKLYGPKGIGALYIRRSQPKLECAPLLDGGGHEGGFRSGTLNVPGIVGLGKACELAMMEMHEQARRLGVLRDRLEQGILSRLPGVSVNGHRTQRLSHVSNLAFEGIDGQALLSTLDDVAVSSGSACTSASIEPSHVLRSMGIPDELAYSAIRFSLGHGNTVEQVDYVIERIVHAVTHLREARSHPSMILS